MKALIVKEDGLIYVNEVPEDPELCIMLDKSLKSDVSLSHISCDILGCACDAKQDNHRKALEAAKSTAVLCADQSAAKGLLYLHGDRSIYDRCGDAVVGFKPGIYPIEGLKCTINADCPTWCSDCKAFDWSSCLDKYVAILSK